MLQIFHDDFTMPFDLLKLHSTRVDVYLLHFMNINFLVLDFNNENTKFIIYYVLGVYEKKSSIGLEPALMYVTMLGYHLPITAFFLTGFQIDHFLEPLGEAWFFFIQNHVYLVQIPATSDFLGLHS